MGEQYYYIYNTTQERPAWKQAYDEMQYAIKRRYLY